MAEQLTDRMDLVRLTLPVTDWQGEDTAMQNCAVAALEDGKLLYLPQLPFALLPGEETLLRPDCVKTGAKSVKFSLSEGRLWGAADGVELPVLAEMLRRYAQTAHNLIASLLPGYLPQLIIGNTSLRPIGAQDRAQSKNHDDRLLHIDSFPSRPMVGKRILRVFTNIHPGEMARVWEVGEPFADVARRYMPSIAPPFPGSAALLHALTLTKEKRSAYDHYMLRMHDRMKQDDGYQREVAKTRLDFIPGASWVVFTDQVSHAALSGQHALEQTFLLPVEAMRSQATAPLRVLEGITGRKLA